MSSNFSYLMSGTEAEAAALHRNWIWMLILGIVLALVGVLAIGYPVAATVTTVRLFGLFLVIGGVFETGGSFFEGRAGRFLMHLLCGLLSLFLGIVILDRPLLGAEGYTLVLALFFFASGLFRIVFALRSRFPGWGWVLLNGGIGLVLGVMIWRQFPESALWVIGTFVGIDLVFNGLSWVMAALAVRRALPRMDSPSEKVLAGA